MGPVVGFKKLPAKSTMVAEVTPEKESITDASLASSISNIVLPVAPAGVANATLPPVPDRDGVTRRLARIDLGFNAPSVSKSVDSSLFGTPCETRLSTKPAPGAMVKLLLSAPCHPNSRVEIGHGKLMVTYRTGHSGTLDVDIPAFEEVAHFSVSFDDGTILKTALRIPDLHEFERVAVQWSGKTELYLHALEFGAQEGSKGHVWQGQPRGLGLSQKYGGGYAMRLGVGNVENPTRVEIYSLPHNKNTKSGVVELIVSAHASEENCDTGQVLYSCRSSGGRLVGATGLQFKFPGCGTATQSMVLKNALRDMIIARQ